MKPFVRSLIAVGSLGAVAAVAGPAMAEESTGIAQDLLECPKTVQQPKGAAQSEAHGFVQIIDEALAQANLTEEQADKLSQLGDEVDKQMAAAHQARRDLMLALAQQLDSGRIDRQALEPQVQALVNAKNEASPAVKGALQTIYDTLKPEQRTAFADALEKSIQQRVQMHGGEQGSWLDQWTSELNLNDQQKQQIRGIFDQLKPVADKHHQRMNQVLSGFRGQSFNIEQAMPSSDVENEAHEAVERTISVAQQISQVLTPQQRTLAARKIVQNACPKVEPQQGAPYGTPQTGQQQMELEGENVGTAEDEIIVGRRGLWGGGFGGGRFFRGVNRFGGTWWPGYGFNRGFINRGFINRGFYGGGFYPGAFSYAYPYASSFAFPYAYNYAAPYFGFWPGYSTYAYTFPYVSSYSWFW